MMYVNNKSHGRGRIELREREGWGRGAGGGEAYLSLSLSPEFCSTFAVAFIIHISHIFVGYFRKCAIDI